MSKSADTAAFKFTPAGNLDPNPTQLRQRAAAALSDIPDGTTFLTIREGAGLGHYVILDDEFAAERSAFALAQTVAAHSAAADVPDLSSSRAVAFLKHERGSIAGSNPQVGADIQAVVGIAASSLRDGEWVAFSVRRPTRAETKRNRKWLEHRGTYTHHSLEVSAVVISMWAGADSASAAKGILRRVAGALPGFDLRTQTGAVSKAQGALPYFAAATLSAAVTWLPFPNVQFGWGGAALAAVLGALVVAGIWPSANRTTRKVLRQGHVPAPPTRTLPPAPPKSGTVDKDGNNVPPRDGEYPLHPAAFMVGASTPITLVAPHAGAESGGTTTLARVAPPVLREPIGPLVGYSEGVPAYLSASDSWSGLMALGEAGSGKSALLQASWGYDAAVKMGQLSTPNCTGRMNAMIAFDTKSDSASAEQYMAWSEAAGDRAIRIDFSDETSPLGIELFPPNDSALNRARRMVNALKFVFGETSIGPESFDTLTRVFVGAFAATPDVVSQVTGLEAGRSPFYYANVLLTSRGDDLGKQLADTIRTKGERTGDEDAREATSMLGSLYDPQRTPAARQALVKAPRNKIEQLVAAEHWWSRPKRATWKSLLEKNASVVINFGSVNGYMADEELSSQVASLMMYTLREAVQRTCIGWYEQQRLVSIYADELKHIAGTNASVISWIRNDARSFGLRGVFATQFPRQLENEVRTTVMGFGTLVCFAQGDSGVIDEVVKSLGGTDWTQSDIFNLPKYHAVVRTVCDQNKETPFTVAIPDFRSMRGEEFLRAQGAQGVIPAASTTHAPSGPQNPVYMPHTAEDDLGHNYRLPAL